MTSLSFRVGLVAMALILAGGQTARPGDRPVKQPATELAMTPAVACRIIDGYEQFEPLPDAAITSDEKLKVYYRPVHYTIEHKGQQYVARFSQDGVIRPKGVKKVVWKKDNILEYEAKGEDPPIRVYLSNSVGLKGLPPGEYEMTITLRDQLRPGASASQILPFRIIPTPAEPTTPDTRPAQESAPTRPQRKAAP